MRHALLAWVVLVYLLAYPCLADETQPRGAFTTIEVETTNEPRASIHAWFLPGSSSARGTVLICHGFHHSKQQMLPYQWIRDDQDWNVIMLDFRGHGESPMPAGNFCTLGYNEQWDLKAMIDWADEHRLAKPYVCMGMSMGAATALRWAGQDSRISGVIAFSPFKTAWDAMHQFRYRGHQLGILPSILLPGGIKRMMQAVDIPAAVAKRDDLRIWITVGDQDWFPTDDQLAILSASRSPAALKRLEILKDSGHAQNWKWKGNDPFIKEFLAASSVSPLPAMPHLSKPKLRASAIGCVALFATAVVFGRMRRASSPLPPGEG